MGSPDLAVILVHYYTPDLVQDAVKALRADLQATGLAAEIVVVDHGSTPEDRELLKTLPVQLLEPGENRGYAGGIEYGLEHTTAPLVVAMNPDVRVRRGCLGALVGEIHRGAALVGPRFFLDETERFLIPPTEERTLPAELWSRLAARGPGWALRARRRWRRHARRHWQATSPLATRSLSGALLAFPRTTVETVPLDTDFFLYFEEDAWQRRLGRRGLSIRYVPSARAVHLHGRSTRREPRAEAWFAESRMRFERKFYGSFGVKLLDWVTPAEPSRRFPDVPDAVRLPPGRPELPRLPDGRGRWMELSTSAKGFPAAAETISDAVRGSWSLPENLWTSLSPGTYLLQLTDAGGTERARWFFEWTERT